MLRKTHSFYPIAVETSGADGCNILLDLACGITSKSQSERHTCLNKSIKSFSNEKVVGI